MDYFRGRTLQEVIDKLNELNIQDYNDYILFREDTKAVDVQLDETAKKQILNSQRVVNTWTEKVV